MKLWLCAFATVCGLLLYAGSPGPDVSPWKREGAFWVQTMQITVPAAMMVVRANSPVTVRGVQSDSITCTVRKRVRARSQAEAERLSSGVQFRGSQQPSYSEFVVASPDVAELNVEVDVRAPRAIRKALVDTRAGNIDAADLEGVLKLETLGGNIQVDRVKGDVYLKTGGGEVKLGEIAGGVRCISAGGSIRANRIQGEAWLETAGGEISVVESGGPLHVSTPGGNIRVQKAKSRVEARTGGGKIEVWEAAGIVTAENSGGSIQVGSAPGVRCESSGGAIQLKAATGPVRAITHVGSILAHLMDGIQNSVLSTDNGDVTVLIPAKMPVTVKALNQGGKSGRIVSEFSEVRVQRAPDGSPRYQADGVLNGGGPLLVISASQGSIYLKKQ
jgi:hypothetical protein